MTMDADKIGSLDLISGPMFSGKTSEILRRLLIDEAIGFRVVYINHSLDTRSSDPFSTHNPLYKKTLEEGKIKFLSSNCLEKITEDIKEFDIIGVDEAQFYPELVQVISRWVEDLNKKVIVAGLTGDFRRKKFGQMLDLQPLADSFVNLTSYCLPCAQAKKRKISNAIFTHRLVKSKGQVQVGGVETYIPVCRKCYKELNSK